MSEHRIMNMPPESDEGSTEYKFKLIDLSASQMNHMASQLKYRIHSSDDCGQAIYEIGLTDDGFPLGLSESEMDASLKSLENVVALTDAVICAIDKHVVTHHADTEEELVKTLMVNRGCDTNLKWTYVNDAKERGAPEFKRLIAEVIIRRNYGTYWETRYGIAGNVDCGKSTLLGVLTSGEYDNGRGSARLAVMKNPHEIDSGRTSCVAQEIVGFDINGASVNEKLAKKSHGGGKIEWSEIVQKSSKVITFFDMAGHLKYLSQTIRGLCSNELDYVLIIVGANMSNVGEDKSGSKKTDNKWLNMTKEHIMISLALGMRCIIVVTKIDMVDPVVRAETITGLKKLIKTKFAHYALDNIDNVKPCVKLMASGKIIPIVEVSNVTGQGHDILRKLLHFLPPRKNYESTFNSPVILQIQDIFRQVEGTSTVIAGMLTSGEVRVADGGKAATVLKIGPLSDGTFIDARVRSIHCKKINVQSAQAGKYVCIGLPKSVDGTRIKKNMFAVSSSMNPKGVWEFWADIRLSKAESASVQVGYTPHCYIGHVRQTCQMLRIIKLPDDDQEDWLSTAVDLPALSAGDDARVLMRFCFRPELVFEEDHKKLVFKESRTKGIGTLVKTTDAVHTAMANKRVTKDAANRLSRRARKELREAARTTTIAKAMAGASASSTSTISKGKMTI
jgi:GTPase